MELTELGRYNTTTEADLVKARLGASGIDAVVQADTAGGLIPSLPSKGVRVLVRESDRAEAMEILERMLPSGQ
jgi:hypothetical protein